MRRTQFRAQERFRLPVLAVGALLLGSVLSVAVVIQSAGLQPTVSVLRATWEDLKNDAAPTLATFDSVAGVAPTQDDYTIFRQVARFLLQDSSVQRVAFVRETRSPDLAAVNGRGFDQGAINDMLARNRHSLRLGVVPLPDRGVLVSSGVIEDLRNHHDKTWREDLASRYEGASAYLVFSRPGYSPDMAVAAIYVELLCGATCGGGYYLQLERQSGTWHLVWLYEKWVA